MPKELDPASVKFFARLSFSNIFKATAGKFENAKEKFRCKLIIDPSTADGKAAMKANEAARKVVGLEAFKKWPMVFKDPKRDSLADGNNFTDEATDEVYDGYEDMMIVTAASDRRPTIVDVDMTPLQAEDGKPYSGCYVKAVIRWYAVTDPKFGGKGIFAGLQAIQFIKDGEPFGGGAVAAEDVFEDESGNEDDESPAVKTKNPRGTAMARKPAADDDDDI